VIRKAKISDAKAIHRLLSAFSDRGEILPRSLNEIYDHLRDHSIYCQGEPESIVGTCAIHVSWENLAEIRSLAVEQGFTKKGVGRALVENCLAEARELGISRVFVLTYKKDFFEKRGFRVIDKADLPHKIWSDCLRCVKFPNCDEVAMIREI
jgi:amino-acid N-acetyltransferase